MITFRVVSQCCIIRILRTNGIWVRKYSSKMMRDFGRSTKVDVHGQLFIHRLTTYHLHRRTKLSIMLIFFNYLITCRLLNLLLVNIYFVCRKMTTFESSGNSQLFWPVVNVIKCHIGCQIQINRRKSFKCDMMYVHAYCINHLQALQKFLIYKIAIT